MGGAGLIVVTALSQVVPGRFENKFASGRSESGRAQTLPGRFPARAGDTGQIVFHTTGPIDSPAEQAAIGRVVAAVTGLPHVAGVQSPVGPAGAGLVGHDGHTAYAIVQFDQTTEDPEPTVQAVVDAARRPPAGLQVEFGGSPFEKR